MTYYAFLCILYTIIKRCHKNGKLYLPWHSWKITVLYIETTYLEPQTPLFPPSYVNLVNPKDHWKIGKSEHNTNCDITVGITISYAPNICITYNSSCSMPDTSRSIKSSAGIVKKQARTTAKMADLGYKCYVPGCAGDVKCRDGLVSVRHGKQITRSNKIMRATKGTWLASC